MNGRIASPTTAYSISTNPTSTRFIGPGDHCFPSLVQFCWDWRKVANAVVYRCDYTTLHTNLILSQHSKERDLLWNPNYILDNAVAPISKKLCNLTDHRLFTKELYKISSGTFLKYLMSQTLSVKAIVLDRILHGIHSNRTSSGALHTACLSNFPHGSHENRTLLNWMKMSLNLDQSERTWDENCNDDVEPWAISFIEIWSQLGLTDTQIEDKETLTVKEDNGDIRYEAGTPNVIEAIPAEGKNSWKKWFEHGTRRMLLELIDETERHLLPLEDLFTSQSGVKRSSDSTEEGQWGDVFIIQCCFCSFILMGLQRVWGYHCSQKKIRLLYLLHPVFSSHGRLKSVMSIQKTHMYRI